MIKNKVKPKIDTIGRIKYHQAHWKI